MITEESRTEDDATLAPEDTRGPGERLSAELHQALIPDEAPAVPGFEVAAGASVRDVGTGRSLWTTFRTAGGRTALATLHAQGSSAIPAHRLGVARALFAALGPREHDLGRLCAAVNEALAQTAAPGWDPVLTCGAIVIGEDGVEWAGAGQPPGGIVRRDGTFEELPFSGPPLGMLEGFQFESRRYPIGTGDTVVILSKGSTGLLRGAGDVVASLHGKPTGEVVASLHRAVEKAQEGSAEEVTVLILRKH